MRTVAKKPARPAKARRSAAKGGRARAPKAKAKTSARGRAGASRSGGRRSGGARQSAMAGYARRAVEAASAYAAAIIVAGALVLVAFLWAGGYLGQLGRSLNAVMEHAAIGAGLSVERVSLRGEREIDPDEVRAAVSSALGRSIFHVDIEAVRADVEALGWVERAAVTRLMPNAIHVSIIERRPIAVWQMAGALHLIDASGARIQPVALSDRPDLPLVVGEGADREAAAFLGDLEDFGEIRARLAAATRSGDRRWTVRLRSGAAIKLPEGQIRSALSIVSELHERDGVLDAPLEYIDLRDPSRAVLRPAGGGAEEIAADRSASASPGRGDRYAAFGDI